MTAQHAKILTRNKENAKAPVVLTGRQKKKYVICTQCDAKEARITASKSAMAGVASSGTGLIARIGSEPKQKIRYRQGPRDENGISPEVPEEELEREGIKGFESAGYCDGCYKDMMGELAQRRIDMAANKEKNSASEGIRK